MKEPLLAIRDLAVHFTTEDGLVKAVDGVSLDVEKGETLGVVGESGSGKSVTFMSILGLVPCPPGRIAGGSAVLGGADLLRADAEALRRVRGRKIAMIFQDPMTSLNPYMRIGRQIAEVLETHLATPRREAEARAIELLRLVKVPDPERRAREYPHQFSGGMRQRAMIAMALACAPEVLIADEPTTALDVTIQAQVLALLRELQQRLGMAIVLITHDLGVVAGMADRVAVMYAGRVIESGPAEDVFVRPRHPYTLGLLRSRPRIDATRGEPLWSIPGAPPAPGRVPAGCPFQPRCSFAVDACRALYPPARTVGEGHTVSCHVEAVA
ncbi:MAG: ABC transporter ATP-binding protein [Myxococcota bacterium]